MTRDTLIEMIARQLNLPLEQITDEASVTEDLGADSLDIVEMLTALEDACQLNIPDEDVVELRTVGDVTAYILSRLTPEQSSEDWNEYDE